MYPPIGATAFLIFSMPELPSAAPRNAVGGQVCGVVGGAAALGAFGLLHRHGAVTGEMSGARVGAIAVALLLATALMLALRVLHPPAGATALMISLGIVARPAEWLTFLGAVVLICAMAIVVNRLVGITYPLWSPPLPRLRARFESAHDDAGGCHVGQAPELRRHRAVPVGAHPGGRVVGAQGLVGVYGAQLHDLLGARYLGPEGESATAVEIPSPPPSSWTTSS